MLTLRIRIIPSTPSQDELYSFGKNDDHRQEPLPRNDSHYYDTFYGRESLVDPITIERPTGVSHETYIEPNVSTMVHTAVTPQSIYGAEYLMPDHATSPPCNELPDPQIRTMSPPTPVKSRMQRFELPVQMQHASIVEFKSAMATMGNAETFTSHPRKPSVAAMGNTETYASHSIKPSVATLGNTENFAPYPRKSSVAAMGNTEIYASHSIKPSVAVVENTEDFAPYPRKSSVAAMGNTEIYASHSIKPSVATLGSTENFAPYPRKPSVATMGNTEIYASHSIKPSVAVVENTESFALQTPPNKKNPSHSTKPASSRQHPQPLPPLVIPPTPVRSVSSPNRHVVMPNQRSSSMQDSPFLTPGTLTPASSRSGISPSPLTVSPRTPSPNTLMPSTSSPLSPVKKDKANAHKKHSFLPDSEAEALVHKGIKFHETGQLEKATELFRQAAIQDFPMAMFLYGVSLRHGWGCKRNEHLAFQYLQKAAEHAVMDLNNFSNAVNTSASKGELIMAIYELGVSFRHGWGCKKNKETAVYFFKIAADLGDADAQNDLGHCYYHGHGVKKDLYMAAKYYRMADKQGHSIMGNSWIHKSKYDKPK
ncbi:hypothetical protein DFQ28_006969 [Apophysomyces sp. BC1034]|nr:hypothetical protein DFQ30_006996 [Apophysomyces sp. BC1015]KAG0176576.1 hypothetical protein DFQ29_005960 [Apophysomyces sp. BC1021]KAG0187014.1 hypothetical protein DFQ28_006969 [Apophysomyces sp. BC1034]